MLVNYGILRRSRSTASTVVRRSKTVVLTTVLPYYGTVVGTFFGVYCIYVRPYVRRVSAHAWLR